MTDRSEPQPLPRRPYTAISRLLNRFPDRRVRRLLRAADVRRVRWRPDVRRATAADRRLKVAWDGLEPRLALVHRGATPADVARRNRGLVVSAAERAGATWFDVSARNAVAREIAVLEEHWDAFARALLEVVDEQPQPVYLGVQALAGLPVVGPAGATGQWHELASVPAIRQEVPRQDVVRVFLTEILPGSNRSWGASVGCTVARWRRDGEDYVAPTRNPTTQRVAASRATPVDEDWRGQVQRRLPDDRRTNHDVDFPVDVVYLWVDGEDPAWQQRFAATKQRLETGNPAQVEEDAKDEANDESVAVWRFRDRDELRHSLRSLELYLPWVRHIYLVTDRQRPHWLREDDPRITVVDHSEIFADPSDLPCFNSHAIGARVHHIPGLSEHYILMNDDLFFNAPLIPEHFFLGNGTSKFFLSKARDPFIEPDQRSAIEAARRNSAGLLERDFGADVRALFLHAPITQRRSVMLELEERYPEAFAALRGSHFR
ncbi:MAG: Stealth CR1 domain-containing protein, partial [Dietzia sp.]|nr:Stealth CR1 domain-containing protein [Dietzia sp.]